MPDNITRSQKMGFALWNGGIFFTKSYWYRVARVAHAHAMSYEPVTRAKMSCHGRWV